MLMGDCYMTSSYKKFWSNLLNFSGTSGRADYWWPVIINYILGAILASGIQAMLGHPYNVHIYTLPDFGANFVANTIFFIVWLGTLSLKFRRLHDSNHSAWWILIDLIPIIGTIWFFILMILPTKRNRYSN